MCILFISVYGRERCKQLRFLCQTPHTRMRRGRPQLRLMRSFSKQQIASGIALVVAALFVVVLHSLNYSKEHQMYGIALVGVFGFLFLSRDKAQQQEDEPWW